MTDKKPQLFISHAAWREGANPEVAIVLEKIREELGNDWEIFVDKYCLPAGTRWRPQILNTLSKSQAAVILFDKNALDHSPWVRAESLILCFRKSLYPNFRLIPILFDRLTVNDTCFCDYQPFQLNEIQAIKTEDNGQQKLLEDILKEVKEGLDSGLATTVREEFSAWKIRFKKCLKEFEMPDLVQTWEYLPNSEIDIETRYGMCAEKELLYAISQSFHHFSPFETLDATRVLSVVLEKTSPSFTEICHLLTIKWVENESVEVFFNLKCKPEQGNLLIYNTPNSEIVKYLFDRLHNDRPMGQHFFPISFSDAEIDAVTYAGANEDENLRIKNRLIREGIEKVLGAKVSSTKSRTSNIGGTKLISMGLAVCYLPRKIADIKILEDLLSDYEDIIFLVQVQVDEKDDDFIKLGALRLTPWLTDEKVEDLQNLEILLHRI